MKVGIINVTGYAGIELARILSNHPETELVAVTGRGESGKHLQEVFPHLHGIDLVIQPDIDQYVDVAYSALPHKASAEACIPLLEQGTKVIDISADFRLEDPELYNAWYGNSHPHPEYLKSAVYGLPELHKEKISTSALIANPGCYPTSAILALAPALTHNIIEPDIVIDSKSGVSGAGRGLTLATHFSEVNENVSAYSIGGHRHLPEIEQELGKISNDTLSIIFVPHLIPMTRGILSTCYAPLRITNLPGPADIQDYLFHIYSEFYQDDPFVKVVTTAPQTKQTLGTNDCIIYPTFDARTNRLLVISCLDNLVKGAAGQAIQNMNIMYNFPQTTGLTPLALYP